MTTSLFFSNLEGAGLLLFLRIAEFTLLFWFMKDIKIHLAPWRLTLLMVVAVPIYTVIYEIRKQPVSMGHLLVSSILHLLLWGIIIFLVYRIKFSLLLNVDLFFFLLTRSSRWMSVSIWLYFRAWYASFTSAFLLNLTFLIILTAIAKRLFPPTRMNFRFQTCPFELMLIVVFLFMRWYSDYIGDSVNDIFQMLLVAMLYLFIIISLFFYERQLVSFWENREKEKMLAVAESRYQQLLDQVEGNEKTRRFYHDISKHLSYMQSNAIPNGAAKEYLNEFKENFLSVSTLLDTGNVFCDTILSNYMERAQKQNIHLICDIDFHEIDFIRPYDICTILCNILDNSFEATEKVTQPGKREIVLKARRINDFFFLKSSNYFDHVLQYDGDQLQTTKKQKELHGIGIGNIKYTVEQYGGNMEIQVEDEEIFTLKILIPVS